MNTEYMLTVNGETVEIIEVEEKTAFDTIQDSPASFSQAMQLVWQGMLGIFIVAALIIAVTSLLNTIFKAKKAE